MMTDEEIQEILKHGPEENPLHNHTTPMPGYTETILGKSTSAIRKNPKPGVCPVCNQEYGWKDSVVRNEYVDYGSYGSGNKIITQYETPGYRVHKKCNDKLNRNLVIVVLLTILLFGSIGGLFYYISTVTTGNVSAIFMIISGFVGFIAGSGVYAMVFFKNLFLLEITSEIFNIKWRVADILQGY